MTPDRLKELNRLARNVESLEQVLSAHRDRNNSFAEDHVSPDTVKRARKILEDDLEKQIVAAKAAFAAADALPVAKHDHPSAQCIKRLRDIADMIESNQAYISTFSLSGMSHHATEIEMRVGWHEIDKSAPLWRTR